MGGLFETGDEGLELAFRYAVDHVNADSSVLPTTRLQVIVERVERHDSFTASKKVCDLLSQSVAAIFGPQSTESSSAVQSTCGALQIPHIQTRWDYRIPPRAHTLNLYPPPSSLGSAYLAYVKEKNWKMFAILYEQNDALIRLQELLKDPMIRTRHVVVRQFEENNNYRKTLKDLGKKGIKNFVVDVDTQDVHLLLKHAQEVDMLTEYFNYVITTLDIHTMNLEDFQYIGTNITGFRIVDDEASDFQEIVQDWRSGTLSGKNFNIDSATYAKNFTTEVALVYDAVWTFATALNTLEKGQRLQVKSISCKDEEPWSYGLKLSRHMRGVELQGLTGRIVFDGKGLRTNFTVKIQDLTHLGLKEVGEWDHNSNGVIRKTGNYTRQLEEVSNSLRNKTLTITTILNDPYMIRVEDENGVSYEGYCVDLIKKIAEDLKFQYKIKEVDDGSYGRKNELGEWNGMIRELIDGKADMAIADLTITYVREEAVDFTMPFMNLGISILFKKPTKKVPKLFSFLSPLSVEVWLYMATAFLGVSLFLFIVARFSAYEWVNPHPCDLEPEELENQFTLLNTLWFTIGCLMCQGCDITPRANSTRLIAVMWWFFTLIMVSSYTANLAAFLTVERLASPIEGAEDLAKQTTIPYGCVRSGSTQSFFKESEFPTYKRMWSFMESYRPEVFTDNNQKGVERVKKGNYAFLMESTTIEFIVERNCELTQVGGLLDSKGYGIATPHGSPYRTHMSSAILKLQESGQLHILKERWWKKRRLTQKCAKDDTSSSSSASELSLANVGGVFLVLICGVLVGCLIVIFEFVWKSRKVPSEERESLCLSLCRELKFAIFCGGSTKPNKNTDETAEDATPHQENGLPFMPMPGFSSSSPSKGFAS
ncbi:glutamate receptor ionotropic, kainate 2-like [Uloborus diversus]|uniref:glutamate receptor ionotropic, kainate 2-like n=1 Tax=Uloborus diversus TaxID=327109 RepID=UPI00240A5A49|nr:glutamate receptor ionotropic, kainate 2-like [Uloborus diversus]